MDNRFWLAIIPVAILLIGFAIMINSMYKRRGVYSFKDILEKTDLPIMTFTQNGKQLNFILDTGCSYCLINKNVVDNFEHTKTNAQTETVGIDGIVHKTPIISLDFEYDGIQFNHFFVLSDLEDSARELKQATGIEVHGLIGSAFFKKYNYILDYENCIVYPNKRL